MTTKKFPEGFLWGAATAAFQVEGAAHAYGRKDSIWDAFCRIPGAVLNGDDGETACDQYHRYPEDIAIMKSLNVASYRFSTSWARVRPDGITGPGGINQEGLDYYSRLVDELLNNDIMPWLTLYHWDLPQALEEEGGWANRDTAYKFVEYAQTMHAALGDRVDVWTTLNEPWCSSFLSYIAGIHAPGRTSKPDGILAAHHLLLGHGLATQELRSLAPEATLGLTLNMTVVDPLDANSPADVDAARRLDGQINRFFADPIFKGEYPADIVEDLARIGLADTLLGAIHDGDMAAISTPIDAFGINYYHGEQVSSQPDPTQRGGEAPVARQVQSPFPDDEGIHFHSRGLPVTGMNWEIQPEGLTRLLHRVQNDYTGPSNTKIYITENGAAFDDVVNSDGEVDDAERSSFYADHLLAIHDAIEQGVAVHGYFAWSLLDNFEWAWGYRQRFGVVYVDFKTQRRTIKTSGKLYGQYAGTNAISVPLKTSE